MQHAPPPGVFFGIWWESLATFDMSLRKVRLLHRIALASKIIAAFFCLLFASSIFLVFLLKWVAPPTSSFMIQKKLEVPNDQHGDRHILHTWVGYEEISPHMLLAVVAAEDQNFPRHFGFDFEAIRKAIKHNESGNHRVLGASTISQQVAKNLFLWSGRSYFRKALEAYFTLLIEWMWDKKRILEVYLNVAQMGERIYGVEAASRTYFRKSASDLTQREAAMLAAILPNPVHYSAKKPSAYVQRRQTWILRQMRLLGGNQYLKDL